MAYIRRGLYPRGLITEIGKAFQIKLQKCGTKRDWKGALIPCFPLLFHQNPAFRTSVIAVPNIFFFPNPTSFCPNFGESCFTSSSQIPYPAPYFGQIPRIAFQNQNKYVLHLLLLNLNGQNVIINRIRFNAFGGGL